MATEVEEHRMVIFRFEETCLGVWVFLGSLFLLFSYFFFVFALWLCPTQLVGVLLVALAADSGPIEVCCCCPSPGVRAW